MSKRKPNWKLITAAREDVGHPIGAFAAKFDGFGSAVLMRVGGHRKWSYCAVGEVDPYDDARGSHVLKTLYGAKMAAEHKARSREGWRP